MKLRRALTLAIAASLAAGCPGKITGPSGPGVPPGGKDGGGGVTDGGGAYLSNLDVYTRLKPTCAGCHTLTARPYFADLTSFDNLIAYNLKWVIPGDPAHSGLIGLMKGTIGEQMPIAPGDRFEVLDQKGQTQITLAEVEQWITNLPPPGDAGTKLDPVLVRRKSAEQIRISLYDQLGLSESDFMVTSSTGTLPYRVDPIAGDSYAVRSIDQVPYSDPFGSAGSLYTALGGSYWQQGKLTNDAVTPNMLQALVPISQTWCRVAFTKGTNPAVLSLASLSDTSASPQGVAKIKANIGYLYLRMLGEPPPQAEVDDLYTSVFVPYEGKGTTVAWTAVCAALIRDPLWILY